MYFDTHVHINSEQLYNDHFNYVQRAISHGVDYMVIVGYDLESSKLAVELANQYENLYAAVGIGPNNCNDITNEEFDEIEKLLKNKKVVAIGEIGLDYYYDYVDKEVQISVLKKQLKLASKYNLPVVIHCRDSYEDMYSCLSNAKQEGIMHCYSGSVEMAKRFIDIGFYISLAGPVTFKNAKIAKEVAKQIDLSNLVIETDCPYLTPEPFRGRVNEPANVIYIAEEIARLKKISIEVVAKVTTSNAKKIFNIH